MFRGDKYVCSLSLKLTREFAAKMQQHFVTLRLTEKLNLQKPLRSTFCFYGMYLVTLTRGSGVIFRCFTSTLCGIKPDLNLLIVILVLKICM
jgi:hypothetical protein